MEQITAKAYLMIDKSMSDIFCSMGRLKPSIEYHTNVVIVGWNEAANPCDINYKYTQFEGDSRFMESYKFYVDLVTYNSEIMTMDKIIFPNIINNLPERIHRMRWN